MNVTNLDIYGFLGSMPTFAAWIAGIIFCIHRASRQPQACLLTGMAIAIAIGGRMILPFVMKFVFSALLNRSGVEVQIFANSLAYGLVSAFSWGLLLWAIFGTGSSSKTRQPNWQADPQRRV